MGDKRHNNSHLGVMFLDLDSKQVIYTDLSPSSGYEETFGAYISMPKGGKALPLVYDGDIKGIKMAESCGNVIFQCIIFE
jgi:hypothetical protein